MIALGARRVTAAAVVALAGAAFPLATAGPAAASLTSCVDQRTGQDRPATVRGTDGPDVLFANSYDVVAAGGGNDVIYTYSWASNVVICGGHGADRVVPYSSTSYGPFSVQGGPGNDNIYGSLTNDVLNGGTDVDFLSGQAGWDFCQNGEIFDGTCEY